MVNKLLTAFENRFDRNYSAELAKIFVQNVSFAECFPNMCDENLDELTAAVYDELYTLVTEKLSSLIPTVRLVERKETINSKRVILVRIYTAYDDGDLVYGIAAWIKTKKGWNKFDPQKKQWTSVTSIPHSKFTVTYQHHGHSFTCKPNPYQDLYFVY